MKILLLRDKDYAFIIGTFNGLIVNNESEKSKARLTKIMEALKRAR
jgi:hypothetical protein